MAGSGHEINQNDLTGECSAWASSNSCVPGDGLFVGGDIFSGLGAFFDWRVLTMGAGGALAASIELNYSIPNASPLTGGLGQELLSLGKIIIVETREHQKKGTTNPANLPKHQKGEKRRKQDAGGEKGDLRRPNKGINPNKRRR